MTQSKGLTGFQLKYIALVAMLLDHIHYFFEFTGKVPIWFSMVGRIAAPLFLFAVVEGFIHTRNRKKYFLRMYGLAALMGLIQFGFYNVLSGLVRSDGFFPKNMMLSSFAVLLVALQGIAWIQEKRWLRGVVMLLLPILVHILTAIGFVVTKDWPFGQFMINLLNYTVLPDIVFITDGGLYTFLAGIVMYLCHKSLKREVAGFVVVQALLTVLPMLTVPDLTIHTIFFKYFEWLSLLAAPLMLLYNGERGHGSKYLFYVFYPTHIYVLYALSCLFS